MKQISCKEAVNFILKKEEGKLSLRDRIYLWRHLAICSLCRIFSDQNALINKTMKQRKEKKFLLSEEEKDQIIQNVLNEKKN